MHVVDYFLSQSKDIKGDNAQGGLAQETQEMNVSEEKTAGSGG